MILDGENSSESKDNLSSIELHKNIGTQSRMTCLEFFFSRMAYKSIKILRKNVPISRRRNEENVSRDYIQFMILQRVIT